MATLWIIDDNTALLKSLELAFHDNYEILTFSDPKACLQAFWEEEIKKPDIILTDYEMPGMDGLKLIRKILEMGYTAGARHAVPLSVKFILCSACLTNELIREAQLLGVAACLGKPFDLGEFKGMIQQLIRKDPGFPLSRE